MQQLNFEPVFRADLCVQHRDIGAERLLRPKLRGPPVQHRKGAVSRIESCVQARVAQGQPLEQSDASAGEHIRFRPDREIVKPHRRCPEPIRRGWISLTPSGMTKRVASKPRSRRSRVVRSPKFHDTVRPLLATRFVVPDGVSEIQPRLIGSGPATVWLDDFSIRTKTNVLAGRRGRLLEGLSLSNACLNVTFNAADGAFSVLDRRTSQLWSQQPFSADVTVLDAQVRSEDRLDVQLLHSGSGLQFRARIQLEPGNRSCGWI